MQSAQGRPCLCREVGPSDPTVVPSNITLSAILNTDNLFCTTRVNKVNINNEREKKVRVSTALHLETIYYFYLIFNFKFRSLLEAIRNSSSNLVC